MSENRDLVALLNVYGFLSSFVGKGRWSPQTRLEGLVLATLIRGRGTYDVIMNLVREDRCLQAAMLGRSLFEDMVVAHWLVLHADDSDWLVDRFERHRDAMRLNEARAREGSEWAASVDDLAGREDSLRREFGEFAQRDWWGRTRDGRPISMPQVVTLLATERAFQPRLKGEAPVLEQYYALQHKNWTQALHHTAFGTQIAASDDGGMPSSRLTDNSAFDILLGNYWVFGQLVFVAIELTVVDPEVREYFEKLFLAGLAVFGEALDISMPWGQDVERWAREMQDDRTAGEDIATS